MSQWMNVLIEGILLGGLYGLLALGLSLSFGIMRIVNIAHGDFAIAGAFVALAVAARTQWNPWLCAATAVPLMMAAGYVLQRWVLNRTVGHDLLPPLLVTFGMSIIVQNLLLQLFSADPQTLDIGALSTQSIHAGVADIGAFPLLTLAVAVGVLAGVQKLFTSTSLGRVLRATSDDRDVVALVGLDAKHVYGVAMALSIGIATIAGVFLAMRANVSPSDGPMRLIYAFEAVIIGGLGSLWGTLAGGMVLGVAQSVGLKLNPGWGILAGHLVFLGALAVRPSGLFPRTRDR
ncbi:branched-chain amino acid ABC transporter permease [Herbaspirillum chlorophenolicum]|jgi:branched-chain amino acid transport system permease protein|uniref:branched-chain amino acid ABC transporter permease n=1 Tax=Herbaspirillum chlorophenolicum TaxID=211589 RepID=UPI00067B680E|nr:branched-chain amino acid ABC transporter permease [Herbaspirillum chlorophenolicum]